MEKLKILMVDDDAKDVEVVRLAMVDEASIFHAPSIAQVPFWSNFDVVICDLTIHGCNKINNIALLKERFPNAPIIATTGGGVNCDEKRKLCFRSGADWFVPKSRMSDQVKDAVFNIVESNKIMDTLKEERISKIGDNIKKITSLCSR